MKRLKVLLLALGSSFGLAMFTISLVSLIRVALDADMNSNGYWKSYNISFNSLRYSSTWFAVFLPTLIFFFYYLTKQKKSVFFDNWF